MGYVYADCCIIYVCTTNVYSTTLTIRLLVRGDFR